MAEGGFRMQPIIIYGAVESKKACGQREHGFIGRRSNPRLNSTTGGSALLNSFGKATILEC
jgi:hypothetical protein